MVLETRTSKPAIKHVRAAALPAPHVEGYELTSIAGVGGMGVVFKARDIEQERLVALKFLPAGCARDDLARQLLISEARLVTPLTHRNICKVHGVGWTHDMEPFIVMAYYDGQTLKARLAASVMPLVQVFEVAAQIADGLAHLHRRAIAHCDITPSNLLMTSEGIKILDFGLAHDGRGEPAFPRASAPGTAAYMAPEQFRGRAGDPRSDLWALGVVLFEMLTGRVPFRGGNDDAIANAVRHQAPAPMTRPCGTLSAAVTRLLRRLLEKHPGRRLRNAAAAARQLRKFAAALGRPGLPPSARPTGGGLIGSRVSHYRITGPLGVGGMGVVYAGYDTRSSMPAALKFVSEHASPDLDAVRRLTREAELMAMLKHPNICSIFEVGRHQGRVYIAMERLDGTDLKRHAVAKKLSTAEILEIAVQITHALEAAHRVGIVHRDLTAANIFLCANRVVKLLDFGLSRQLKPGVADEGEVEGATRPGRPLGTANYMAPERILQLPLDPRSDLFSLGVVLYEMATGRLPFAGGTPADTVFNVLSMDPEPLGNVGPDRPKGLQHIVAKLLAKRPEQRYQSGLEVRRALQSLSLSRERQKPASSKLRGARHDAHCRPSVRACN